MESDFTDITHFNTQINNLILRSSHPLNIIVFSSSNIDDQGRLNPELRVIYSKRSEKVFLITDSAEGNFGVFVILFGSIKQIISSYYVSFSDKMNSQCISKLESVFGRLEVKKKILGKSSGMRPEEKLAEELTKFSNSKLSNIGVKNLEEEVREIFQENEIVDHEDLLKIIQRKTDELNDAKSKNKTKNIEALEGELIKLTEIKTLSLGIEKQKILKIEDELNRVYRENELESLEELNEIIEKKTKEKEDYIQKNKKANATKCEEDLMKFSQIKEKSLKLLSLKQNVEEYKNSDNKAAVDKTSSIRDRQINSDLSEPHDENDVIILEKELKEGFDKYEISSIVDLIAEMEKFKKEAEENTKKGKLMRAKEANESYKALESLHHLYQKIDSIKKNLSMDNLESDTIRKSLSEDILDQQIKDLYNSLDLRDQNDLEEEIIKTQNEIKIAKSKERLKTVENYEAKLKELNDLNQKVQLLNKKRGQLNELDSRFVKKQEQINTSGGTHVNIETPTPSETMISKELEIMKYLHESLITVPPCSEKSFLKIKCWLWFKKEFKDNIGVEMPLNLKEAILEELKNGKKMLENENLFTHNISQSLANLESRVRLEVWEKALDDIDSVLTELITVDLSSLMFYMKKAEENANLILNQDVILILGGTGVGKSTTLHLLGGSQFIQSACKTRVEITKIGNSKGLEKISTSANAKSETRYISPIIINLSELGMYNPTSLIICDSPGFEDTGGSEIDIANNFGIIKAIQKCSSVKPIILISRNSLGERMKGARDLIHLLTKMIKDLGSYMDSFTYLFSKFSQNEADMIFTEFKNLMNGLTSQERADEGFVEFLGDMMTKVKNGPLVVDPLAQDARLNLLQEILKVNKIRIPGDAFTTSMSEKSRSDLKVQIQKHQTAVLQALIRNDISLVEYKLNQLKNLMESLDLSIVSDGYDACVLAVREKLKREFNSAISILANSFLISNKLTLENVNEYIQATEISIRFQNIIRNHLPSDTITHSNYLLFLEEKIREIQAFITKAKIEEHNSLHIWMEKLRFAKNFEKLEINLKQSKLAPFDFKPIIKCYAEASSKLTEIFDRSIKPFEELLSEEKFYEAALVLAKILNADKSLHKHLSPQIAEKIMKLKDALIRNLNIMIEKINYLNQFTTITEKHVEKLDHAFNKIKLIKSSFEIMSFFSVETLDSIQAKFENKIDSYFEEIEKLIDANLNQESAFSNIETYVEQLQLLCSLKGMEIKLQRRKQDIMNKIINKAIDCKKEIERVFDEILSNENKYHEIADKIKFLSKNEWIEKYYPGKFTSLIAHLTDEITRIARRIKKKFVRIEIEQSNPEHLIIKSKMLDQLFSLKELIPENDDIKFPEILENSDSPRMILQLEDMIDASVLASDEKPDSKDKNDQQTLTSLYEMCLKSYEKDFKRIIVDVEFNEIRKDFQTVVKMISYISEFLRVRNELFTDCLDQIFGTAKEKKNQLEISINKSYQELVSLIKENLERIFGKYLDLDKNSKKEDCEKNLRLSCESLNRSLGDLFEMEASFSRIKYEITLTKVNSTIKNYFMEFKAKFDTCIQNCIHHAKYSEARLYLSLCKNLKFIDLFNFETDFTSLVIKTESDLNIHIDQTNDKFLSNLNSNEYEIVLEIMKKIEHDDDGGKNFQAKKIAINKHFEQLVDESKHLALTVILISTRENDKFQKLKKFYKAFSEFERTLKPFLKEEKLFIDSFSNLKKLVSDRVDSTHRLLNYYMENFDLDRADDIINELKLFHCHFFELWPEKFQLETLEENLRSFFTKIFENCVKESTISDPKIFKKLFEAASKVKSDIYKSELIKLEKIFRFSYEKESGLAVQENSMTSKALNKCQDLVQNAPEKMKSDYEKEFNSLKAKLRENHSKLYKEIESTIKSDDFETKKKAFVKYNEQKSSFSAGKIKRNILDSLEAIFNEYVKELSNMNVIKALDLLKRFYDKNFIIRDVMDTKTYVGNFKSRLSGYSVSMMNSLNEMDKIKSNADYDKAKLAFDSIQELLDFQINYSEISSLFLENVHLAGFEDKIIALCKTLELCSQKFLAALDASEFHESYNHYSSFNIYADKFFGYIKNTIKTGKIDFEKEFKILSKVQMEKNLKEKLEKMIHELENFNIIDAFSLYEDDVLKNFENFDKSIKIIKSLRKVQMTEIGIDFTNVFTIISNKFSSNAKVIFEDSINMINGINLENDYGAKSKTINKNLKILSALKSYVKELKIIDYTNELNALLENRIKELEIKAYQSFNSPESLVKILIIVKKASLEFPVLKDFIKIVIDRVLKEIIQKKGTSESLVKYGILLENDRSGYGQMIIQEHSIFSNYKILLFNRNSNKFQLDKSEKNPEQNPFLMKMKGDDSLNLSNLVSKYFEFEKCFDSIISEYLSKDVDFPKLIAETIKLTENSKDSKGKVNWNSMLKKKIPNLLAHVFAYWTLKNAGNFFEMRSEDQNKKDHLFKPHLIQILSIFRLLGLADKNDPKIENHLIEIGTGEGKSITLAGCSAVLALVGYDVSCVCYSEYLSVRDYNYFADLFFGLGIDQYVHYGTFNKLCEMQINESGDIRQRLDSFIRTGSSSISNLQKEKRQKILLIDEVDVFFSKDFFSEPYVPSLGFKNEYIEKIIRFIWNNRSSKLSYDTIIQTKEYQALKSEFPNWIELFEQCIMDLLIDVNSYLSMPYIVHDNKIGYAEHDGVSFKTNYGYKTLFAYFHENTETKKITDTALQQYIQFLISCGKFAYAEMPKLYFEKILGVTGTLESLSPEEMNLIKNEYKINKFTFTPSVHGDSKRTFDMKSDVHVVEPAHYYNTILSEIESRKNGKDQKQRAVLVFFDSKKSLYNFYNSNEFIAYVHSAQIITEDTPVEEKEAYIKQATMSGKVSLLTRAFGRGTDFTCMDQNVIEGGGVHVIQTFFSENYSEEVQIRGRCARQGQKGSYSLIINQNDLELLKITEDHFKSLNDGSFTSKWGNRMRTFMGVQIYTIYDLMNSQRRLIFEESFNETFKQFRENITSHQDSMEFIKSLNSGDYGKVKDYLVKIHKSTYVEAKLSRTVCLMDATCSMGSTLDKCKLKVEQMFERAIEVLKENDIPEGSFQMQFAVYRNYNSSAEDILVSSPWETKSENLKKFMSEIVPKGGWGNEAIEVGLAHALLENSKEKITQIILIGDADPNSPEEVEYNRREKGETYWSNTKFREIVTWISEVEKCKRLGIPINTFHVASRAEKSFKCMADETNGVNRMLDIESSKGGEILLNFVTESILKDVGNAKGKGDIFVEAYKKKYAKSYL